MKKIILTALLAILSLGSTYAQSTMSDDQVIKFVIKEQKAGSSQQQIVTKLVQKGVDIDQIRRVRKKYERMKKGDGMGSVRDKNMTEDEEIDARLRRNNALDKSELSTTEKLKDDKLKISYPPNWSETLKLWYEDAEARRNKTLLRHENPYVYHVKYCVDNANYNNKSFYKFAVNTFVKKALSQNIKKGKIDTLW